MTCTLTADHEGHDVTTLAEESEVVKTSLNSLISTCLEKIPQVDFYVVVGTHGLEFNSMEMRRRYHNYVLVGTHDLDSKCELNPIEMDAFVVLCPWNILGHLRMGTDLWQCAPMETFIVLPHWDTQPPSP